MTYLPSFMLSGKLGLIQGLADLARLAQEHEGITLAPQTQARILKAVNQTGFIGDDLVPILRLE